MTIPTLTDRLQVATERAEGASTILHQVANGGPTEEVQTESGPVPTIQKWFADLEEGTDSAIVQLQADLAAEEQARQSADQTLAQGIAAQAQALQAHVEADDPHPQYTTAGEVSTAIASALAANRPNYSVITANTNAVAGGSYAADTTAAGLTLTLPAAPQQNDFVNVVDQAGTFATNPLTIGRNGKTIMGLAEDMACRTNYLSFTLIYIGTTWKLV